MHIHTTSIYLHMIHKNMQLFCTVVIFKDSQWSFFVEDRSRQVVNFFFQTLSRAVRSRIGQRRRLQIGDGMLYPKKKEPVGSLRTQLRGCILSTGEILSRQYCLTFRPKNVRRRLSNSIFCYLFY